MHEAGLAAKSVAGMKESQFNHRELCSIRVEPSAGCVCVCVCALCRVQL